MVLVRADSGPGTGAKRAPMLRRLAAVGAVETDAEEHRLRRSVLVLSTVLVSAATPFWIITYLVLGLLLPALIPLGYFLVSVGLLFWFARTKRYAPFRGIQLTLMLVLPFLLQWSLGGFAASSAVALWALTSALGALMFSGTRAAIPWFAGYLALLGISTAIEPLLQPVPVPDAVRVVFFVGNLAGPSLVAYLLLQYFVREREREHQRSERLLLNVLPAPVATRLKRSEEIIADRFPEATVLFADIVDFTPLSAVLTPEDLVELLDDVFTAFDRMADEYGLEKIKTIGDSYMVAAGIPIPRTDHCEAVAKMALAMLHESKGRFVGGHKLRLRIGVATGPVIAGVIGRRKFIYDLWGETVNAASRMESHGVPDSIQVTAPVYQRLRDRYEFQPRGTIQVKGMGPTPTWLLLGRRGAPARARSRAGEPTQNRG